MFRTQFIQGGNRVVDVRLFDNKRWFESKDVRIIEVRGRENIVLVQEELGDRCGEFFSAEPFANGGLVQFEAVIVPLEEVSRGDLSVEHIEQYGDVKPPLFEI